MPRWPISTTIGAAGQAGRPGARPSLHSSTSRAASGGRCASMPAGCRGGYSTRSAACRARRARDYLSFARLLRGSDDKTICQVVHCAGPLYERLARPLWLAALNTEPKEASAGSRRRHRPRDAGGGRQGLPAADRPRRAGPRLHRAGAALSRPSAACRSSSDTGCARSISRGTGSRGLDFGEDKIALGRRRCRDPRGAAGRGRGSGARSHDAVANSAPSSMHISASIRPPGLRPSSGSSMAPSSGCSPFPIGLSVTISAADRLLDVPRETLAADNLGGGRDGRRPSQVAAAVADRARAPRDLRRDAGRECQAPRCEDRMAQPGPRRRLDQDRLAGDHRRCDPVRQSGGRSRRSRS